MDDLRSPIHTPTGDQLHCRSWQQEGALRALMNSLDPAVAERPEELIACGPTGKPAQDMNSAGEIVRALNGLDDATTLLIDSGRLAGMLRTSREAPRILILRRSGVTESGSAVLAIHAEIAAAGWVWVGTQGVLPTAYETLAAAARIHFGGTLAGRLIISGGLGGAGGAQPLAAVMNGAAFLGIEADVKKITRRVRAGYCDYCVNSLDEALRILKNALRRKEAVSVGLVGNCADVFPELAERGVCPALLTDQTAAHDPLNGYIPGGLTLEQASELRARNPEDYLKRTYESIGRHVTAMLEIKAMGSMAFDFGNRLAAIALERANIQGAAKIQDFMSAFLKPRLAAGGRPLLCMALSGLGSDIQQFNEMLERFFPRDEPLMDWLRLTRRAPRFQGLPARVYWLDVEQRIAFAERVNSLVARGSLQAPVVMAIGLAGSAATLLSEAAVTAAGALAGHEGKNHGSAMAGDLVTCLASAAPGASWVAVNAATSGSASGIAAIVLEGNPVTQQPFQRLLSPID